MDTIRERLETALGDRYDIVRELGRGGAATVFLAEDRKHRRQVALKVLRPELTASIGPERFLREIEIAARLEHPHILTLIDSGEADGLLYFVMPFIEGESLRARIQREGRLPVTDAARLLRDVVDALATAHRMGVVHRDIKPDNVLLSGRHAVIADFGVAKALGEATGRHDVTTAGLTLGTPAYMSPEQAAADPTVDHRADLYAVGILGYEMLAGHPPFVADTPQAVLLAQVTRPPKPITEIRPDTPPALAELLMRCLAKEPGARWQSADDLLQRVEAALAGLEVTPTGQPPIVRAERARWRVPAIGAGVVLAMAAAALLWRPSAPASSTGSERATIVVLPFENIGTTENEYFADGVTQEITSQLGGVPNLGVVARTSAIQYRGTTKPVRQIGDELGAQYILSGTVQWQRGTTGDRVRITPVLVRVEDGTQLWTARYDEVLADIFRVQSDVAAQVAEALNLTFAEGRRTGRVPTRNLAAYDLYLQANNLRWRGFDAVGFLRAADLYERALALDPEFAEAWAALSIVQSNIHWFGYDATEERLRRAREAAERALELSPDLPEALQAMGRYHYTRRDYARALPVLESAAARAPNESGFVYELANIRRRTGDMEAALRFYEQGFRLDQRNATIAHSVGSTALYMRRYDEALRYFQLAASIQPDWPHPQIYTVWATLARDGDATAAARALRAVVAARAPLPVVMLIDDLWPWWLARILTGHDRTLERVFMPEYFGIDTVSYLLTRAEVATIRDDRPGALAYYDSARVRLEDPATRLPVEAARLSLLAVTLAGTGNHAEAVRQARAAVEMLPVEQDALWGSSIRMNLALVLARTGDAEGATTILRDLLRIPGILNPHLLRLDPAWAPLAPLPAFAALTH